MSEIWTASMGGVPWDADKMEQAVSQLRHRGTISFVVGSDTTEDLQELDRRVFARRPDLILKIDNPQEEDRYSEDFLDTLADLRHVAALQLHLRQRQDLSKLAAVKGMQYLNLRADKKQSIDFIRNYKHLTYLALSGKFEELSPIEDCIRLTTLVLNTAVNSLDFLVDLPFITYLAIDSVPLNGPLEVLAASNLTMLRLSSVRNLTSIDAISHLHNLTSLQLSLPKVEQLCDLSRLTRLAQLELDYMKSLRNVNGLWSASGLEVLLLKEISKSVTAEELARLASMDSLRQVDFRFMDTGKQRIAALRKHMHEAGKEHIIIENIPEAHRIPSLALTHLSKILT
ncbi:hypothetical protein [Paenibacillus daejeonensis]|uniref:hypothetical protein n=1 Tax=Paenibacillus daejeonensis TaxID=135193 RepID=UPI000369D213|nr:hypothetical protein [Paenibacillus daejeonensis]